MAADENICGFIIKKVDFIPTGAELIAELKFKSQFKFNFRVKKQLINTCLAAKAKNCL